MLSRSNFEIQQTQDLAFQTERIERQEVPAGVVPCGAKILYTNIVTGGTLYTSVPKNYVGPCSVLDISSSSSNQEPLATLPSSKEAQMLAFFAISPDGGYSEVLVEATGNPVTHQSYVDWL